MKIGILQAGYTPKPLADEFGQYPAMFERLLTGHGFEFKTYDVANNQFPKNINVCDGWLITGSANSAYEDMAFIAKLETFIKNVYSAKIPIVGICFGHQILAQALGGKVDKYIDGLNIGQSSYQLGNQTIDLLAIHQDQVTTIPDCAQVILSNGFCKNAGLTYNNKAISFQPHPEFSPKFMNALIDLKSNKELSEQQAIQKKIAVNTVNDSNMLTRIISEFFKSNGSIKPSV